MPMMGSEGGSAIILFFIPSFYRVVASLRCLLHSHSMHRRAVQGFTRGMQTRQGPLYLCNVDVLDICICICHGKVRKKFRSQEMRRNCIC